MGLSLFSRRPKQTTASPTFPPAQTAPGECLSASELMLAVDDKLPADRKAHYESCAACLADAGEYGVTRYDT